jgi:hypothetical protein
MSRKTMFAAMALTPVMCLRVGLLGISREGLRTKMQRLGLTGSD